MSQGSVPPPVETFGGTMTLDDGEQVRVELVLESETLTLRTGGNLIGAWPVKYCRISRSGRGAFLLSIDGEKVVFEPGELEAFATTAAHRFRASTLADRIGVVRDIPNPASPAGARSRFAAEGRQEAPARQRLGHLVRSMDRGFPGWLIPALTAAAVVLVVGALMWRSNGIVPSTPGGSTIDISSTPTPSPPLFEQSLTEFTSEWNLAATTFGVPARIRGVLTEGQFESQITASVTLQGRTDADGRIGSLVLVIDPRGAAEQNRVALQAINLAVRIASPELDAGARAQVIEDLGLDVADPVFDPLDEVVDVGTVEYTLASIPEFHSVLFTVNRA